MLLLMYYIGHREIHYKDFTGAHNQLMHITSEVPKTNVDISFTSYSFFHKQTLYRVELL